MKAVVLPAVNMISITDVPRPTLATGEALVSLHAAALNHRDVWIKQGAYAGLKWPCIPGSDGAGIVTAVGEGVDRSWLGREVIINPSLGWGDSEAAQGPGFAILGLPRDGTFAEQIAIPASQLAPKPSHLTWAEAAALPLAGLTAWRAVHARAGVQRGDRVLVTGVGGGVASFAVQFAAAIGAHVWVTSSSDDKIAEATALGAEGGFNYTRDGWAAEAVALVTRGFDVIVDSAGGPGFEALIELAAPGGRIVFFGATRGNPPVLPMRRIFWRQLSLLGTTMGSPSDWSAMVQFVDEHRVRPMVGTVLPLDRAADAFDLMENGGQFGKIALQIV